MVNIFVYGTLRTEGHLNKLLTHRGYSPLGIYHTDKLYTMYDVGVPIVSKGGESSITGEIYCVDLDNIPEAHGVETSAGYFLDEIKMEDFPGVAYAYFQELESWRVYAEVVVGSDWI